MPTITIPLYDAKRLATALVPHTTQDDVTPVLSHVVIGGDNGAFAYATDRYTVGRYDLTNIVQEFPETEIQIHRDILSALRRVGGTVLPHSRDLDKYAVRISTVPIDKYRRQTTASVVFRGHDGDLNETHWMRLWESAVGYGNFPTVRTLLDGFVAGRAAKVVVNGPQVGKFSNFSRLYSVNMRLTMPQAVNNKLSPILVEVGNRLKGLIQPNLEFGNEFGVDLAEQNIARNTEAEQKESDTGE